MMTDDHEEILRDIEQLNRKPIQRHLARSLSVRPTQQALQTFANRYPDRHAQQIAILMRACGYEQAQVIDVRHSGKIQHIQSLSDAELSILADELVKSLIAHGNMQQRAITEQAINSTG